LATVQQGTGSTVGQQETDADVSMADAQAQIGKVGHVQLLRSRSGWLGAWATYQQPRG
jgi:hypothetical protein